MPMSPLRLLALAVVAMFVKVRDVLAPINGRR